MKNILLYASIFTFIFSCSPQENKKIKEQLEPNIVESSDWLGTSAQSNEETQIIRLAWGIFPKKFFSEAEQRFQEMKNAGITHCVDWRDYSIPQCKILLDAAQTAGIKIILNCEEMSSNPELVVSQFKDHPALDGYYLGDEPYSDMFSTYGALADRIRELDKEHYVYLNMLPGYTQNYKNYVKDIISIVNPKFLSFDNYTLYYTDESEELIVHPKMFENLEIIRNSANESNKDFWAFCITSSHIVDDGKRLFPDPVLGHMRYYVYNNLAYGANAIEYFTYWQAKPSDKPNSNGQYFLTAPISYEGEKGPIYDRLQKINAEIKNLSFVFSDAKVNWVRLTGSTIPGTKKLTTELDNTPIKEFEASGGIVISLLENASNNYLIVVNRDPTKSIVLNIESLSSVKRVLKSGAVINAGNKLKIMEGDVAIYTWP
jgi:hypothetical protein